MVDVGTAAATVRALAGEGGGNVTAEMALCATAAAPYRRLGPACPLLARKFPSETVPAVLRALSSCDSGLAILQEGCDAGIQWKAADNHELKMLLLGLLVYVPTMTWLLSVCRKKESFVPVMRRVSSSPSPVRLAGGRTSATSPQRLLLGGKPPSRAASFVEGSRKA
jgi:hypothetical protein